MQRDDPTGHRPGGPAPGGPGAGPDTVLAALAHRLRARSERQQLLTERLRSGELRPGALADLAELAAAARRGVRDGDHVLVMAGAEVSDRGSGGGPVPLGQALSAAVSASEAASRTVVPPTPSLSLEPSAATVFGQILSELLAHATAATAPGERLEIHTRFAPDGGLALELLSPRPVATRTPVDELDRMLAAGRPDGPVAPQEIGLYLAARLARAIGGRLGVRGSPGVASAPGPSPVAVLQLPPTALAGSRSSGDDGEARPAADLPGAPDDAVPAGEEPTGLVPAAPSAPSMPSMPSMPPTPSMPTAPAASSDPEPSVPPWPPVPAAEAGAASPDGLSSTGPSAGLPTNGTPASGTPSNGTPSNGMAANGTGPNGIAANGAAPDAGPSGDPQDGPGVARIPVPPTPGSTPPVPPERPSFPFPPAAHTGPPPGPTGAGLQIPPGPRGPGGPPSSGPGGPPQGPNQPGPGQPWSGGPGPNQQGPNPSGPAMPGQHGLGQQGPGQQGPGQQGPARPGAPNPPGRPVDVPPVTEALPVSGTTPPVELFGPFDSEVPVPVDDLDGTPIFAAVASAWFRDPGTPAGGAPGPAAATNGHRPGEEPANWSSAGDAEFEAARSRADRVVEPPVNANGLPMRRPGQQMVPPARRDNPAAPQRVPGSAERQPDRVRNRLASYQRGLREGRHRAAEESSGPPAGADVNGASPHGRNGHAAG